MARGDHWWDEPPLWAWVTMVVGLVSIIVMLPIALNRTAPTFSPSEGQQGAPDKYLTQHQEPSDALPRPFIFIQFIPTDYKLSRCRPPHH